MNENVFSHQDLGDLFGQENTVDVIDWIGVSDSTITRRNRGQLVETFPLLLPALVRRPCDHDLMQITAAIDEGLQLIEAIALLVGVQKKTVRFLRGIKPSQIGKNWIEDPLLLFRILDRVPDHRRPRNADEWRLLTEFWQGSLHASLSGHRELNGFGEFGQHLFLGFCMAGYKKTENTLYHYLRRTGSWAGFADFVRNVGCWCERRAREQQFNDAVVGVARDQIAIELLTRYPAIRLLEMAEQWQQSTMRDRARAAKIIHWPALLPEPMTCQGLTVLTLNDSLQLFTEGAQLNHCVSTYIPMCLLGLSHILAIRGDAGESLSTAEITLQEDHVGWLSPVVNQHTGVNNSAPDARSARALAAAMHRLQAPGMQNWFKQMGELRAERQNEIDHYLLHENCADAVNAISEVIPRRGQVDRWLEQRLVEEDLWHSHHSDLAQEAAVKVGLGNLHCEDAYELWNEDPFRWGQYERMTGREQYF